MSTGCAIWQYGPIDSSAGSFDRRLDKLPQLVIATFRDVYGLASPQDLVVATNTDYLGRELGIPSVRNWSYLG
ncbi:hypothetical protein GFY24_09335 [Nocardia sp. SYP-A9097]|uniref:hypothetical protein n=1 Tax=Nocardia sp. SYP-A9097 TaxID=2663237 RepID=UPI00129BA797|nr:hypothetical protein [Nocardia sp. SYP-A9097]MRH87651.1 hypothetical protein [Nocardia sp. SYP-A9097]